MQRFAALYPLFAGRNPMEDLTDYFRGPRVRLGVNDAVILLIGLAGLILLLWLLSLLMNWQERGRRRPSPWRLFFELSRAHRLGWPDVWLLWRLARSQRLHDPARLFLEPERFMPVHLTGPLRRNAGRLEALRERLFAHAENTPPRDDRTPTRQPSSGDRQETPLPPIT